MISANVGRETRNCRECQDRTGFCNMPEEVLHDLEISKEEVVRAAKSILYSQGEKCHGVFVICKGRVKLVNTFADGRHALLKICGPGELLGVSEALTDRSYAATAHVLEDSIFAYIAREQFIHMMARHSIVGVRTSECLSADCLHAYGDLGFLRIPSSALERLVRLLIRWSGVNGGARSVAVPLLYTHAEIAQLIGASRETVTRLINNLQRDGLIHALNGTITLLDVPKLKTICHAML